MAHKSFVNGTSYKISGGNTLVDGTAYSIKNGKTLVGGTAYEMGFCKPLSEYDIGDTVSLNVNGSPTEFLVVHHGLPSSLYDDSCNGTWLLTKTFYTEEYWNYSKINTYATSDVHSYLNNTFFGLLDADIQSAVKQIKLPYCVGNGDATIKSGANGLLTKVFLLSAFEVGSPKYQHYPIDGAKLDYFIQGSSSEAKERRKNYGESGVRASWCLRTPYTKNTYDIIGVSMMGGMVEVICGVTKENIRPALILPSDFEI